MTSLQYIQNYNLYTKKDVPIRISFDLYDVPLALGNSLRRILSSRIPTVAFDDTWDDDEDSRSIVIYKNTSGLHNEFLSHRLALIPLDMNHPSIQIKTKFDINSGKRSYIFDENATVPIFSLKKKNNLETKGLLDKNGMLNVYSSDFTISNAPFTYNEFFHPDPNIIESQEFVLIDKLKSNFNNEDDGEEIDLICKPTIGYGWMNARYDPTGTVSFGFKTAEEAEVNAIFQNKLAYMNDERKQKKLNPYSEIEVKQLQNSFNLLDKERVFVKNQDGMPRIFEMSIESIGFMRPAQILTSALYMFRLLLADVKNSIEIKTIPNDISIELHPKLTFMKSTINEHGWVIRIHDEDHTLGNVISKYIRMTYNKTEDDLLKYVAYKMEHPLINNVDVIITPHLIRDKYMEWIQKTYYGENISQTLQEIGINVDLLSRLSDESFYQLVATLIFIRSINMILNDIQKLIQETLELSGENDPIFSIMDSSDYHMKYSDL
jgi:DNA-directed RNA polymerase subunit L